MRNIGRNRVRGRKIPKNETGALEGLPLYLIILVVTTAVALTIIMAWMGSITAPKAFGDITAEPATIVIEDDDGDSYSSTEDLDLIITVRDSGGSRVKGAAVTLSGCDVRYSSGGTAYAITDENGEAVFENLHLEVLNVGTLTVTAQKSGYPTKEGTIPVIG